jgi:hypothetical protein
VRSYLFWAYRYELRKIATIKSSIDIGWLIFVIR